MFNTNFKAIAINTIFSLIVATLILSCSNTNNNQLEEEGQVSFSIGGSNGANPMANTMSANTYTISNVSAAKLTIMDTSDNIAFDGSIELNTFNNEYVSKTILLPTGDYKLTSFVLLDSNGDAEYGVPISNSTYASLVSNPLAISFSISKDNLFNQVLEIILIDEYASTSDFGLINFDFDLVNFMSFGIYVYDEDALMSALSANLLITSNTKNVSKYLEAQLNTITIKDEGYDTNYLLTISKQGYEPQTYNLTYDEIISYGLIVSLRKKGTLSWNNNIGNLKTGQKKIYADGDDGYYQKGLTKAYTRDNTTNIVTDNTTKLMWQDDEALMKNWSDAISYCEDLSLGGYNDWSLPTKAELLTIVDNAKNNPAIDDIFQATISDFYWSSTSYAISTSSALFVGFRSGYTNDYNKLYDNYVHCVRGRQ